MTDKGLVLSKRKNKYKDSTASCWIAVVQEPGRKDLFPAFVKSLSHEVLLGQKEVVVLPKLKMIRGGNLIVKIN